MPKRLLAFLLATSAAFAAHGALAAGGDPTPAPTAPPSVVSCTPLKVIYARSNWRDRTPLDGRTPCDGRRKKAKADFHLYRHYRLIAPFRCARGTEGYYAKSCAVVDCEGGVGGWSVENEIGAKGPYQFVGWPVPWPVRNFRDRVAHHEQAADLAISNWDASRSCWG